MSLVHFFYLICINQRWPPLYQGSHSHGSNRRIMYWNACLLYIFRVLGWFMMCISHFECIVAFKIPNSRWPPFCRLWTIAKQINCGMSLCDTCILHIFRVMSQFLCVNCSFDAPQASKCKIQYGRQFFETNNRIGAMYLIGFVVVCVSYMSQSE